MNVIRTLSKAERIAYLEALNREAEAAFCRKGEKPNDIPPAELTISQHLMYTQQKHLHGVVSGPHARITNILMPESYLPSTASTHRLEEILISEMRLETHHRGRKVYLRVVTPPGRFNALSTVVEDPAGTAVWLALYQVPLESQMAANKILFEGRICLLKEPFFRAAADGSYILRVDHVSDIQWLGEDDENVPVKWRQHDRIIPTSQDIRQEGNEAVKQENWEVAVRHYSRAIETAETIEEADLARLNRSFANLKLGRFRNALDDATNQGNPSLEKVLFRKARALFELAKYEQSSQVFHTLSTQYPNNKAVLPHIELCAARIEEAQHGNYSWKRMYKQASKADSIVDCATYSDPVTIKPSPGKGRGLFTNRAVPAGGLLLCEKAFGYHDSGIATPSVMLFQLGSKCSYRNGHTHLIRQLVQKLKNNPDSSEDFLSLDHGDYKPSPIRKVDERPIVDTFLVMNTYLANGFDTEITSLSKFRNDLVKTPAEEEIRSSNCGIWTTAAFINHSCVGNCQPSYIGDIQIWRATRDLPAGTELLFPYKAPDESYSYAEAQDKLKNWGFKCTCAACSEKKSLTDAQLAKRRTLLCRLEHHVELTKTWDANISEVKGVLEELEATYETPAIRPSHPDDAILPRPQVADCCAALSILFLTRKKYTHAIDMAFRALRALGFDLVEPRLQDGAPEEASRFLVKSWGVEPGSAINAFHVLFQAWRHRQPRLAGDAKRFLATSYAMTVGEYETLADTFPI